MDEQTAEVTSRRSWLKMAGAGAVGAVGASVVVASPALAVGSTFVPITPYRVMDTRAGLPVQQGVEIDRSVLKDLVGNPKIPATATAVAYNLTAVKTSLSGWLALFPADVDWPGTSSLNWSSSGLDIANGGIVRIGVSANTGAGSVTIRCGGAPGCQTHALIDVTGYFA